MTDRYGTPGLPLGVAIIAILVGIVGAFLFVSGIIVILASLVHTISSGQFATWFGQTLLAGIVTLIFGLILVAVAFGLWDQSLWAYALAVLVLIVSFVFDLGRPIYDSRANITGNVVASAVFTVPAIVTLLLLIYLLLVHEHFY
ncbi:MAG: hypothetical protein WAN74_02815 [Thermoplasmata archaeon]